MKDKYLEGKKMSAYAILAGCSMNAWMQREMGRNEIDDGFLRMGEVQIYKILEQVAKYYSKK